MTEKLAKVLPADATIERVGKADGRWPNYRFVVNGVDLGRVRRVLTGGADILCPHVRYDSWEIRGVYCSSRDEAETTLVERAVRFRDLVL
jgi:hypothetical protein